MEETDSKLMVCSAEKVSASEVTTNSTEEAAAQPVPAATEKMAEEAEAFDDLETIIR